MAHGCVLDEGEQHRLTRAIELAARVIEGEGTVDLNAAST